MAGPSEDVRLAVFDFEEDLFLEPFDLFDEADLELLRAQAQQNALLQSPAATCEETDVSHEQSVPPTASTSTAAATQSTVDDPSSLKGIEVPAADGPVPAEPAPDIVEKLQHCVKVAASKVEQVAVTG